LDIILLFLFPAIIDRSYSLLSLLIIRVVFFLKTFFFFIRFFFKLWLFEGVSA